MNPYHPEAPVTPEQFAGRRVILNQFRALVEEAIEYSRSSNVLIIGDRGFGKTSTLRKLEAISVQTLSNALTYELTFLEPPANPGALVTSIVRGLHEALAAQAPRSAIFRAVLRRVESVTVGPVVIGLRAADDVGEAQGIWTRFHDHLAQIPVLVVGLDNCELLDARSLECVKMLAEFQCPVPTVLILSGTRKLAETLSSPETRHVGRTFSRHRYDLSDFSEDETSAALRLPHPQIGGWVEWSAEAVGLVHRLTFGQPYLVQCFGYAAFDELSGTINEARVRATVLEALNTAQPYLADRFSRLTNLRAQQFYKIALMEERVLSRNNLRTRGVGASDVKALCKCGILRIVAPDRLELLAPPAFAFFESIRRGLPDPGPEH
jgi:AAA ATPase domain